MRARLKAPEDLPYWARCCSEAVKLFIKAHKDRPIIELTGKPFKELMGCSCGSIRMFNVYLIKGSNEVVDVSLIDIEEGSEGES